MPKWEYMIFELDPKSFLGPTGLKKMLELMLEEGEEDQASPEKAIQHLTQIKLNELGEDGWELSGVQHDTENGRTQFYLKRPL